ncbi:MAG: hypothetical protein WC979_10215 [Candidatus Pacearchaeota archaeon]|jgi:hypothetical protein
MKNPILIVEDQKLTLESVEFAVNKVMPKYHSDFQKGQYDIARCYRDARDKIIENVYQFIFLDHRLPMNDPLNLEDTNFNAFCESLVDIGYSLIEGIKARNLPTVIIGTSSLRGQDLSMFPKPDYKMSKMWGDAEKNLEDILRQINNK